ncbi:MAG: nucleotide exchange factor GrpE [bacterium]
MEEEKEWAFGVAEELIRLRERVEKAEAEILKVRFPAQEILDFSGFRRELQQLRWEVERLQKTVEIDRKEESTREVVKGLIQVMDAFDRFQETKRGVEVEAGVKGWLDGFSAIAFLFEKALEGMGVTRIEAVGKPFDPNIHQVVGIVEDEGKPEGMVVQEAAKGYLFRGKVLRPSQVWIVKRKEK